MDTYLQRKKRGWVESSELLAFQDHSVAELLVLLSDEQTLLRTIAAHLLPINCETTNFLLAALIVEPALYTRLAITEKLESGDQMTARQMLPLLAEIGNNQHSTPIDPSKKSSFPLPRDLIARSLGRIQPSIFPTLLAAATDLPVLKLSELIDAIGYLAFYHAELTTSEHFEALLKIKNAHKEEPLIQWKFLICFSAFPQSAPLLQQEKQFVPEAQRSLKLLQRKKV